MHNIPELIHLYPREAGDYWDVHKGPPRIKNIIDL